MCCIVWTSGGLKCAQTFCLMNSSLGFVKAVPCVSEPLKRLIGMCFKVGIMDQIKDGASSLDDLRISSVGNNCKKNLLHVLILVSGPLKNKGYPILKMMKAWVCRHRLEMLINCIFPTSKGFCKPLVQVISEDALVKVVKDVRGKKGKYITEGMFFQNGLTGHKPSLISASGAYPLIARCSVLRLLSGSRRDESLVAARHLRHLFC